MQNASHPGVVDGEAPLGELLVAAAATEALALGVHVEVGGEVLPAPEAAAAHAAAVGLSVAVVALAAVAPEVAHAHKGWKTVRMLKVSSWDSYTSVLSSVRVLNKTGMESASVRKVKAISCSKTLKTNVYGLMVYTVGSYVTKRQQQLEVDFTAWERSLRKKVTVQDQVNHKLVH